MPSRFTVVRILLGLALLATAGLKLYGLSVSAIPRVGWFAQSWIQIAAAEWELVLGIWLLSGAYPRLSWLAGVCTFAAFAVVSGYLGWVGVASCGCFGVVKASPWWAFGVDVAALALLAISRPGAEVSTRAKWWLSVGGGVKWVCGVGLLLVGLTAAGAWYAGSPEAALARLRGAALTVTNSYVDLGTGHPGDQLEANVSVRNWTNRPVRVVGGTSDCSCTALADLPLTIGPESEANIVIRLSIPETAQGQLTRTVLLGTDSPDQPRVGFRVGCRVE